MHVLPDFHSFQCRGGGLHIYLRSTNVLLFSAITYSTTYISAGMGVKGNRWSIQHTFCSGLPVQRCFCKDNVRTASSQFHARMLCWDIVQIFFRPCRANKPVQNQTARHWNRFVKQKSLQAASVLSILPSMQPTGYCFILFSFIMMIILGVKN